MFIRVHRKKPSHLKTLSLNIRRTSKRRLIDIRESKKYGNKLTSRSRSTPTRVSKAPDLTRNWPLLKNRTLKKRAQKSFTKTGTLTDFSGRLRPFLTRLSMQKLRKFFGPLAKPQDFFRFGNAREDGRKKKKIKTTVELRRMQIDYPHLLPPIVRIKLPFLSHPN